MTDDIAKAHLHAHLKAHRENEEIRAKLENAEEAVQQLSASNSDLLDRNAALEKELTSLRARWDSSAEVGHEAEDLRREIEDLIGAYGDIDHDDLQGVLDRVDARDSLAWLQSRDDARLALENRELRRKLEVKEEAFDHLAERVGSFTAMKDEASRAWTRITQLESKCSGLERDLAERKSAMRSISKAIEAPPRVARDGRWARDVIRKIEGILGKAK